MKTDYAMGYDAGLGVAIHLLTCGALRKDVTLVEIAEHLAMMRTDREERAEMTAARSPSRAPECDRVTHAPQVPQPFSQSGEDGLPSHVKDSK